VRLPRLTLAKLKSEKDVAIAVMNQAVDDRRVLLAALKDVVALVDEMEKDVMRPPFMRLTGAQLRRREAARLLSLGI
jgi:hypothetical protein